MARLKDPERRSLILDIALTLFAERGFHAVSVKDIAEPSGISLGSLYTYFTSKEQLVNELFRQCKGKFAAAVSQGTEEAMGRAAHRLMWTNIGQFMVEHPKAFSFLESQLHATYLDAQSVALERELNRSAAQYYLERLQLALKPEEVQLIISASFGAYVQAFKAAEVGLLSIDSISLERLEVLVWRMASAA